MDEPATDDADDADDEDMARDRVARLLPHLDALVGFARKRVGDPALANDVVQDAMLKAVQHAPEVRDDEQLLAWVYRILRNTITDALRHRHVEQKRSHEMPADLAAQEADMAELCRCMKPLIAQLKPEYAAVLQDDLAGVSLDQTAKRLGIDIGNVKVRRHRARGALRERLEQVCRTCARHGCLDCHCSEAPGQSRPGSA